MLGLETQGMLGTRPSPRVPICEDRRAPGKAACETGVSPNTGSSMRACEPSRVRPTGLSGAQSTPSTGEARMYVIAKASWPGDQLWGSGGCPGLNGVSECAGPAP